MTDVLIWTAGILGYAAGAITVMVAVAVQERIWSRRLARELQEAEAAQ
jgi:hypothetical protein